MFAVRPCRSILAVETAGGRVRSSLHWFDPITNVALVEPVKVYEEEHQRRGLARAMLWPRIERLVARAAERSKISTRPAAG